MATEDPVIFPEGIGVVPWMVPGGKEIADASVKLMEKYRVVVWAHHGLFVCGDTFDEAFGLMDTVEKPRKFVSKSYRWAVKNRRFLGRALYSLLRISILI